MELKISSVLALWKSRKYLNYRNAIEGVEYVSKILTQNDSDIFLFPGGFIVDNVTNRRRNIKSQLQNLCSDLEKTIITGFDKRDMKKDQPDGQPLIISHNADYTFRQAAISHNSEFNQSRAEQKRIFDYTKNNETINIAVLSCGEIFHPEFRKEFEKQVKEKGKPILLFNLVHNGCGWESKPCRKHLAAYSQSAFFYTYHLKSIPKQLGTKQPKYSDLLAKKTDIHEHYALLHYLVTV